jgi:hypothetical protein
MHPSGRETEEHRHVLVVLEDEHNYIRRWGSRGDRASSRRNANTRPNQRTASPGALLWPPVYEQQWLMGSSAWAKLKRPGTVKRQESSDSQQAIRRDWTSTRKRQNGRILEQSLNGIGARCKRVCKREVRGERSRSRWRKTKWSTEPRVINFSG